MVAREGAGNFVSGFLSTFDPQAFTRGYQRAQDRAERKRIRDADVAFRDKQFGLQEKEYDFRKTKYNEQEARRKQEKLVKDAEARLNRSREVYDKMYAKLDPQKNPLAMAELETIRGPFINAKNDADRVRLLKGVVDKRAQDKVNYERFLKEKARAGRAVPDSRADETKLERDLSNYLNRYHPNAQVVDKTPLPTALNAIKKGVRGVVNDQYLEDKAAYNWAQEQLIRKSEGRSYQTFASYKSRPENMDPAVIAIRAKIPLERLIPRYVVNDRGLPLYYDQLLRLMGSPQVASRYGFTKDTPPSMQKLIQGRMAGRVAAQRQQ